MRQRTQERRQLSQEDDPMSSMSSSATSFSGEGLKLPAEVFPYQQTWQDTVVDARQ
jgi:hypothetical protein